MKTAKTEISLIIPCYNEETIISESHERLTKVMKQIDKGYELIFINDGSTDLTGSKLEDIAKTDPLLKIISFSKNFGHQNAISAGLKYCTGNVAVIIDADLQDPPEVIPEMLRIWKNENANVVYGVRKSRKGESVFKLLTAKIFYRLISHMSDVAIPVDAGDFRLIDRTIIDNFNKLREKNKYIRGLISWFGYKQCPVYYVRNERIAGKTKFSFGKMFNFATNGLLYFSKKPLQLAMVLGCVCTSLAMMYIAVNLFCWFYGLKILLPGWTSVIVMITFFGGVQLLTVGILGQYIGIIFDEIKDRPEYVISRTTNIEKNSDAR